ncbi:hypothetical protein CDAR_570161 [Caerostris darwini]|uniref:Uncharacterized protein n=1 Tax=Caerostris darwini TaxID=1538125 RepID=A0AAV4RZ93_9ARAC|nr:hypothetical protein CDAR_570161 [Caerostris darwini]
MEMENLFWIVACEKEDEIMPQRDGSLKARDGRRSIPKIRFLCTKASKSARNRVTLKVKGGGGAGRQTIREVMLQRKASKTILVE